MALRTCESERSALIRATAPCTPPWGPVAFMRRGIHISTSAYGKSNSGGITPTMTYGSAQCRMGAQQREEAGCGSARDYLIGLAVSVDGHIVPEVARCFFEEVAAHAPGLVVVRRNLVQRLLGAGLLDSHHARRSLIR